MACGLFPVVTDIRANREWVEDGETGLVFAPGDPLSLATALTSALDLDGGRWEPARTRNRDLVVRTGNVRTNMRRMEQLLTRASDERSRPDDDAVRRN
jgi:glycosyltransferase involved in cell wall biosynthesis